MARVDAIQVLEHMRACAVEYTTKTGRPMPERGDLVDFLAIAFAENFGRTPSADLADDKSNTAGNTPPSTDRGMWMLNSYWKPWADASDAVAYDWRAATKYVCDHTHAFTVGKTNWSAYGDGLPTDPYRTHVPISWTFMRLMLARDREREALAKAAGLADTNVSLSTSLAAADRMVAEKTAQVTALEQEIVTRQAEVERMRVDNAAFQAKIAGAQVKLDELSVAAEQVRIALS